MERLKRGLLGDVQGIVRFEEPLKRYTTYRIGGPADVLVVPASYQDVALVIKAAHEYGYPLFVMGCGSNLLVHDEGVRGIVLRLGNLMGQVTTSGNTITAGAGSLLPKVAKIAADHGLTGLEWGGGVPGTVGGAVSMNAGAHGGETSDILIAATVLDRTGQRHDLTSEDMGFRYRRSDLVKDNGLIVLEATFRLEQEDPAVVMNKMKAFALRRRMTQPLGQPSSGSVFRNPPGDYAGRLIEAAGLKGHRVGGAAVSTVHGNFIVNTGGARARDVLALIRLIQSRVKAEFAVDLELEVELVGWDT